MNKKKIKAFKKNLAEQLRDVAQILLDKDLVRDTGPLLSASSACQSNIDSEKWSYVCSNLIFIVDTNHLNQYKKTIPPNLQQITVELSVSASGKCQEADNCEDPFETLEVDCKIAAQAQDGFYHGAWHLDRNFGSVGDASKNFIHPCYHFQYGGQGLPLDVKYGNALFIDPPRLAHLPLDACLAIDFVLTNYFPGTWCDLRLNNVQYERIIQEAQNRCWRPYAVASASWWKIRKVIDPPWSAIEIWPSLVPV